MKKLWIILIILVFIIPTAWYLLSPLFITVEINEANPLEEKLLEQKIIIDNTKTITMDDKTKKAFEEQVAAMKDSVIIMDDSMNAVSDILAEGNFIANAHDVKGKASLIEIDGKKILRFEHFETINGPDLRIYLSTDTSNNDFIELSKIKATKGNVNYDIADSVDVKKYNYVLVWCKPFGVLFSYAKLE